MSLIDKDALMQSLGITNMECDKCAWFDWKWGNCKRGGDFEDACCAIENAPTVEERKKGKWIYGEDEYGIDGYHCDKCGFFVPWNYLNMFINYIEDYKFCPNCGADMRGGQDGKIFP